MFGLTDFDTLMYEFGCLGVQQNITVSHKWERLAKYELFWQGGGGSADFTPWQVAEDIGEQPLTGGFQNAWIYM